MYAVNALVDNGVAGSLEDVSTGHDVSLLIQRGTGEVTLTHAAVTEGLVIRFALAFGENLMEGLSGQVI